MVISAPVERLLDCPRVQKWCNQDNNFAAQVDRVRKVLSLATDEIIHIITGICFYNLEIENTLADKPFSSEIFDLKVICRQLEQSRKAAVVTRLCPSNAPDSFVTAFCSELSSISSTIEEGKSPGHQIINYMRKSRDMDSPWSLLEGVIYAPFIDGQRSAVMALAPELEDSHYLFSLERGGALVADQITQGQQIEQYKIKKRRLSPEEVERLSAKTADHYKVQQQADLAAKIASLMIGHQKLSITIAITETMVGGGSANDILRTLSGIMAKYPQLKAKILLLEQTMHRENRKGRRSQRGGKRILERRLNQITEERVRVVIASTRYILGEDVDYQLAPDSSRPLVVFEGANENLIAYQITPLGDSTSRDILLDLIDGAYSGQLPGIF